MFGSRWREICLLGLTVLIGLIDMVLCRGFSLWVLYLLPIGVSAWLLSLRFSFVVVLLAVGLTGFDGLVLGNPFISLQMYLYAFACRALAFMVVAVLGNRARLVNELEHQVKAYEELCDSLHISPHDVRDPVTTSQLRSE